MLNRIQEAAIFPWWIVAAGFVAWVMWAAKRYAARHPKEEPMKVTDPVCAMAIDVDQAASKAEYHGKTYYFCSDACRKRFDADPTKFTAGTQPGHGAHH